MVLASRLRFYYRIFEVSQYRNEFRLCHVRMPGPNPNQKRSTVYWGYVLSETVYRNTNNRRRLSLLPSPRTVLSRSPRFPTMDAGSQRPKDRENVIAALNNAIKTSNLAEKKSSVPLTKAVLDSVNALLATIRVRFFYLCEDLL